MEVFSLSWFIISGVVFVASFVRGVSGFGFALVLVPVLLLFVDPRDVVVTSLSLGFAGQIVLLIYSFKKVDLKRILPMAGSSLLGIPVGVWIISVISPNTLKLVIAVVILCSAVLLACGYRKSITNERVSGGVVGFVSGILASSTSLGGPPVVLFMHNQDWPKEAIYPSLAAYFGFVMVFSLMALLISGNVTTGNITTSLTFLPAMLLGILTGLFFFRRVSHRFFRLFSMIVIIGAAIMGIISALGFVSI